MDGDAIPRDRGHWKETNLGILDLLRSRYLRAFKCHVGSQIYVLEARLKICINRSSYKSNIMNPRVSMRQYRQKI